jgi:Arc/MetJ-type ribon-helix-helix transcriptional regulator
MFNMLITLVEQVQKMKNQDARISARLTAQERQRIEQLVAEGKFNDLSDFLRAAVARLLEPIGC